jgi:hypothetical protein
VPESKKRKRPERTSRPVGGRTGRQARPEEGTQSPLAGPAHAGAVRIGVLWLVVFYITQGRMGGLPYASEWNNWNLLVGFGFIIAGFGLSTQWR